MTLTGYRPKTAVAYHAWRCRSRGAVRRAGRRTLSVNGAYAARRPGDGSGNRKAAARCLAVQLACSRRAAASALSSGRVLRAITAPGAALCTALITASKIDRLWGGRRRPAPITTQS